VPAFYTARVQIETNPDTAPFAVIDAYERDREVLIFGGGSVLRVGFTEAEVDTGSEGFILAANPPQPFRFILPAGCDLWIREDGSGGIGAHTDIDIMVAAA
jgi:hypothetical protein